MSLFGVFFYFIKVPDKGRRRRNESVYCESFVQISHGDAFTVTVSGPLHTSADPSAGVCRKTLILGRARSHAFFFLNSTFGFEAFPPPFFKLEKDFQRWDLFMILEAAGGI